MRPTFGTVRKVTSPGGASRADVSAGLRQIVADYRGRGEDVASDPRLAEAVLLDHFPASPAEVRALVEAIRSGSVQQLRDRPPRTDPELALSAFEEHLTTSGLREDLARWAAEAWWDALGLGDRSATTTAGGAGARALAYSPPTAEIVPPAPPERLDVTPPSAAPTIAAPSGPPRPGPFGGSPVPHAATVGTGLAETVDREADWQLTRGLAPPGGSPPPPTAHGRWPRRWSRGTRLAVIAGVIVAGYLGVANNAHLPPFAKKPSTTTTTSGTPPPSTGSPTPTTSATLSNRLQGLIPNERSSSCTPFAAGNLPPNAAAGFSCSPVSGDPTVGYFIYSSHSDAATSFQDNLPQSTYLPKEWCEYSATAKDTYSAYKGGPTIGQLACFPESGGREVWLWWNYAGNVVAIFTGSGYTQQQLDTFWGGLGPN